MRTAFALALSLLLLAPGAQAQFVSGGKTLYVGQTVELADGLPSDTVVVAYRPSSSITERDTLFREVGLLHWTPRQAGVVQLATPDGTVRATYSVRFDSPPLWGWAVLFGAGLILFGGATYAFRKLFEGDDDQPVL